MTKNLGFPVVARRWSGTLAGVASVLGMTASAIIAFLQVKNGESSWAVTDEISRPVCTYGKGLSYAISSWNAIPGDPVLLLELFTH